MGFLDNVLNKSVPQGSSPAKPLLLALGALLASGARHASSRRRPRVPLPSRVLADCLED